MSAKLLHALSDENPDLHKQIGCMTGIFQLFDRHHILTPKRITGYNNHKKPPSGHSQISSEKHGVESHNVHYLPATKEKNQNKNVIENPRISMESARASFSSSTCSSSFSSVECNKPAQPEMVSFDRAINPELAMREPSAAQATGSAQLKKSSDFRDVVKDSIYKETRPLSVKTTAKEEAVSRVMKHRDSPRPLQASRYVDASGERGPNGNHRVPIDLKDSLNVLSRLQDTPRYYDAREPPRSSYESRDRTSFSIPKDTPRFSYDGREISRSSFESRDTFKTTAKLRELPRLSLDSRASSIRGSEADAKSNSLLRDFQRGGGNPNRTLSTEQGSESHKQNHSVVAKLMGLETMPKSCPSSDAQVGLTKTYLYPGDTHDSLSRSSRTTNDCKQSSCSPRSSLKDSVSPRLRTADSVPKPLSSSRFPIEPAPWKQMDGDNVLQKPVFRSRDSPPRGPTASPSVYAEIEKRLKELEFKQSDKDLRALKQILDAMHAKGFLETKKKEDQGFVSETNHGERDQHTLDQNPRLARRSLISTHPISSAPRGISSPRAFESPIVIMKPAKNIEKSGVPASSVMSIDGISSLRRIRSGNSMDSKKSMVNNRISKDLAPKLSPRESVKQPLSSTDKKRNTRNIRSTSSPAMSQPLPRESPVSLGRSSGPGSPRLQQKKLDMEKQSRNPTPSSDHPRKISLRQTTDCGSPGGKRRLRSLNLQQSDEKQLSELSCETRNTSQQGDEISLRSDSNISLTSQIDTEVTSADRSGDINNAFFHQGTRSPSRKVANNMISSLKQKKSSQRPNEDGPLEFTTVAPEQPSPVSVLDASFYSDDLPSPERKISEPFKVGDIQISDGSVGEDMIKSTNTNYILDSKDLSLSAEMNRKKLENVEQLVLKLTRLNSNHNEATTDYIASLCENTNPDHRYISEILLASGLLLRDLGSGLTTIQLHKSGYPINPDLFFVLEQTKASNGFTKDRHFHEHAVQSRPNLEKAHRKLVFDFVNEVLEAKLAFPELCQRADKLAGRRLNGQQLLKELCAEIEQLQANEDLDCSSDDADDFLKTILCKDVMSQTDKWTDFQRENSGIVLDIERLIFKDLIDEIISGEASGLRAKPGRRCRQLFAK